MVGCYYLNIKFMNIILSCTPIRIKFLQLKVFKKIILESTQNLLNIIAILIHMFRLENDIRIKSKK